LGHHWRYIDTSHSANVHRFAQFIDSVLKGRKGQSICFHDENQRTTWKKVSVFSFTRSMTHLSSLSHLMTRNSSMV